MRTAEQCVPNTGTGTMQKNLTTRSFLRGYNHAATRIEPTTSIESHYSPFYVYFFHIALTYTSLFTVSIPLRARFRTRRYRFIDITNWKA